jgi:predicted anti-sigma-YlaC factor YlaD
VAEHLDRCAPCRDLLAQYQRQDAIISSALAPDPWTESRVLAATRQALRNPAQANRYRVGVLQVAAATATAIVLVVAGLMARGPGAQRAFISEDHAVRTALLHSVEADADHPPQGVRTLARIGTFNGTTVWRVTLTGKKVQIVSPDGSGVIAHRETVLLDAYTGGFRGTIV